MPDFDEDLDSDEESDEDTDESSDESEDENEDEKEDEDKDEEGDDEHKKEDKNEITIIKELPYQDKPLRPVQGCKRHSDIPSRNKREKKKKYYRQADN